MAPGLTALLLTCNEEANLARTLDALAALEPELERVVLIDSGSTDATLNLARKHAPKGAALEVLQRPFDSFARQWNFGLAQVHSPWVMSLDADYQVPPALALEVKRAIAEAPSDLAGFALSFRYCVAGRPLAGTLLPDRVALFRPPTTATPSSWKSKVALAACNSPFTTTIANRSSAGSQRNCATCGRNGTSSADVPGGSCRPPTDSANTRPWPPWRWPCCACWVAATSGMDAGACFMQPNGSTPSCC